MIQRLRFALPMMGALSLLGACGPNNTTDVIEEAYVPPDVPRPDVVMGDGGAPDGDIDGSAMPDVVSADGDLPDGADAAPMPDVIASDGAVTMGRCTTVGATLSLAMEPRRREREFFVRGSTTGFAISGLVQQAAIDQMGFFRTNAMGVSAGYTNITATMIGVSLGGGGFAQSSGGYAVAFHSNSMNGLETYLQRLDNGGVVMGAPVRLSNDRELSEIPQAVAVPTGTLVVWRSTDDTIGGQKLLATVVPTGSSAPGAVQTLTPATVAPGAFEVVVDGTRVAVAYVARRTTGGDLNVLSLNASTAALDRTIEVTTGGFITDSVGAVLRGTEIITAWVERRPDGALHLRRADVATGVQGPQVNVPEVGLDISQPGLAADVSGGVVVAFRAPSMGGGSAAIARINSSLALQEGVSRVGAAAVGAAVRVAAGPDRVYAVTWADDDMTPMTRGTMQVMSCP